MMELHESSLLAGLKQEEQKISMMLLMPKH